VRRRLVLDGDIQGAVRLIVIGLPLPTRACRRPRNAMTLAWRTTASASNARRNPKTGDESISEACADTAQTPSAQVAPLPRAAASNFVLADATTRTSAGERRKKLRSWHHHATWYSIDVEPCRTGLGQHITRIEESVRSSQRTLLAGQRK
jgi:hypothetical protein